MLNKILVLLIGSLFFASVLCYSQEDVLRPSGRKGELTEVPHRKIPIILGAELGLNYNMFTSNMTWSIPGINSPMRVFESGNGVSGLFSLLADYSFTKNAGLQGKLGLDWKNFSNKSTGTAEDVYNYGSYCDADYDYTISGLYFNLELLFRYNFTDELFMLIGPVFQTPFGKFNMEINGNIRSGDCIFVCSGGKTINIKDDFTPDTRTGIIAGVGYKYLINNKLWLVPQLRIQFMPTKYGEDERNIQDIFYPYTIPTFDYTNKHLNSIQLALAIWFEL